MSVLVLPGVMKGRRLIGALCKSEHTNRTVLMYTILFNDAKKRHIYMLAKRGEEGVVYCVSHPHYVKNINSGVHINKNGLSLFEQLYFFAVLIELSLYRGTI